MRAFRLNSAHTARLPDDPALHQVQPRIPAEYRSQGLKGGELSVETSC